jgi:hypothetical protein
MHVLIEAIAIFVVFVAVFIGPIWAAHVRYWKRKLRQEVEGRRMDAWLRGDADDFYHRCQIAQCLLGVRNRGGNSHQRRLARRRMERAQKLGAV